jgi:hypothetical protein
VGGLIEKHSIPIFIKKKEPSKEIKANTIGFDANQLAAKRQIIINGPSVNIGAAAVLAPALIPPDRVSRITIVNNGPGFIPSMMPSETPATISPMITFNSNSIP